MPQGQAGSARLSTRIIGAAVAAVTMVACVFCSYSQAFASFSSESAVQTIGVGRIQSLTVVVPAASAAPADSASHFVAPLQLAAAESSEQEATNQLAKPVERGIADVEEVLSDLNDIKRFGEPDENGWFTTQSSAYGPSSAGQFTATGTELTLESAGVAIRVDCLDLMGRTIEIMYGGQILRAQIVDNGTLAPGRLLDFQPGLCTAFGAETPEFSWGLRTVKWRLVD